MLLSGSQDRLVKQEVFVGWKEVSKHVRHGKQLDLLRSGTMRMNEGVRRAVGRFVQAHDHSLLQTLVAVWGELMRDARKARELARANLRAESVQAESRVRTIMLLSGSQDRLVKQEVFVGWKEAVKHVHHEKQMELLR